MGDPNGYSFSVDKDLSEMEWAIKSELIHFLTSQTTKKVSDRNKRQFSETPMVLGTKLGYRQFFLDGMGRLGPITRGPAFKPGENVAECIKMNNSMGIRHVNKTPELPEDTVLRSNDITLTVKKDGSFTIRDNRSGDNLSMAAGGELAVYAPYSNSGEVLFHTLSANTVIDVWSESIPVDATNHKVGSIDCTCGFYSYTSYDHTEHFSGSDTLSVFGIIENYGVCTVGTLGVRSSKCVIKAVTRPSASGLLSHSASMKITAITNQMVRNYPDVQVFDSLDEMSLAFPLSEVSETVVDWDKGFDPVMKSDPSKSSGASLFTSTQSIIQKAVSDYNNSLYAQTLPIDVWGYPKRPKR